MCTTSTGTVTGSAASEAPVSAWPAAIPTSPTTTKSRLVKRPRRAPVAAMAGEVRSWWPWDQRGRSGTVLGPGGRLIPGRGTPRGVPAVHFQS